MSDQAISPQDGGAETDIYLPPPQLHWFLVLLFGCMTESLFYYVWMFVQARWVKKVTGKSLAWGWSVVCIALSALTLLRDINHYVQLGHLPARAGYFDGVLAGIYIVTVFALQQELEETIPSLQLSGIMTFFFGPVYFQYHLQKVRLSAVAAAPLSPTEGS